MAPQKAEQQDVEEDTADTTIHEMAVRPSISVHMIRHAESRNNEVYRDARYIYKGGSPDFDKDGWINYVNTHRSSDPGLSTIGKEQAQYLAQFLVPHLRNQASEPVRIVVSPMRRTLETIKPTINELTKKSMHACQVAVNGFFHESEGCHQNDIAEEGMTQREVSQVLAEDSSSPEFRPSALEFVGFPDSNRGWYCNGTKAETRAESEMRAAKFYMWLCEYLDQQLAEAAPDVFDASVSEFGEEHEKEHDKLAPRKRRRRTALLVGHGDFMSLVLKRIVAGFGHFVENEGIPHRSAFVHFNTGITELEYFGKGRFLIMAHNQTPHIPMEKYDTLRSGGSLKDGWSYLMPNDHFILDAEVSVAFLDELEDHVREQTDALKALYLSDWDNSFHSGESNLLIEEESHSTKQSDQVKHFIVKRGLQVVGVAAFSEKTGVLTDVAVRPSAGKEVTQTLLNAVKNYSRKIGRSGSLLVLPRTAETRKLVQELGFEELDCENEGIIQARL